MSVYLTRKELATFAQNGFDQPDIKNTVEMYRRQGLPDDEIRKKIDTRLDAFYKAEYGADAVEKARTIGQEMQANRPSNTLLDNLLTKEALGAGLGGGLVAAERAINGATLGAYDWANTKLGGASRERVQNLLQMADDGGAGYAMRGALLASEIGGSGYGPIARAVGVAGNAATKGISNLLAREVAQGAITGGIYGGAHGAFGSDFDLNSTAKGAAIGAAIGGAIPVAKEGVKLANKGVKSAITGIKKGLEKTKFVGGALGRSPEEIAIGAREISGAMPDSGEMAGNAVKNLSDDVMRGVKDKSTALYEKAEKLAAGRPVVLDKNSNFAKTFNKLSQNATKTGRAELNKVWEEVGHSKYDAPTYETAKTYRSWLSEKSATGGTGLTKKQYGDLVAALDKDIEASIGSKAMAAKRAADAFYRNEMSNPDSLTNSVDKILRKDPVSVVGNRAISSAQGKAWKASPLAKLIEKGEQINSPYVEEVKQALQANTITRAQFNRMSPLQKQMIYGDKLPLAEKNFNGGVLNWAENALLKGTDVVMVPVEKSLTVITPVSGQVGGTAYSTANDLFK